LTSLLGKIDKNKKNNEEKVNQISLWPDEHIVFVPFILKYEFIQHGLRTVELVEMYSNKYHKS